jgi:hypothetical protein
MATPGLLGDRYQPFTGTCALEGYVELMSEWVEAATKGQPVDELIPVNVAPTPESAKLLQTRLTFLGADVIPLYS